MPVDAELSKFCHIPLTVAWSLWVGGSSTLSPREPAQISRKCEESPAAWARPGQPRDEDHSRLGWTVGVILAAAPLNVALSKLRSYSWILIVKSGNNSSFHIGLLWGLNKDNTWSAGQCIMHYCLCHGTGRKYMCSYFPPYAWKPQKGYIING